MSVLVRLIERASVRKRAADLVELRALLAPVSGVRLLDVGGGAGEALFVENFTAECLHDGNG